MGQLEQFLSDIAPNGDWQPLIDYINQNYISKEEKEAEDDILFDIDMQLYDEFNDKIATMNDYLGDIYSLRDIEEVENARREKEIRLLRIAIAKQQKELENNKKFKKDIVNLIMIWDKENLPKNKAVIETLETIMHEFSRLENIEDEKIQVAVKFIEEKRDKYWKDKIIEKIKELEKEAFKSIAISEKINVLKDLLEENNND